MKPCTGYLEAHGRPLSKAGLAFWAVFGALHTVGVQVPGVQVPGVQVPGVQVPEIWGIYTRPVRETISKVVRCEPRSAWMSSPMTLQVDSELS